MKNSLENILLKIINEEIQATIIQEKGGSALKTFTTILEQLYTGFWTKFKANAPGGGTTAAMRRAAMGLQNVLKNVDDITNVNTTVLRYLTSLRQVEKIFRKLSGNARMLMNPEGKLLEAFSKVLGGPSTIDSIGAIGKAISKINVLSTATDIDNVVNGTVRAGQTYDLFKKLRKAMGLKGADEATDFQTIKGYIDAAGEIGMPRGSSVVDTLLKAEKLETTLFGPAAGGVDAAQRGAVRGGLAHAYRKMAGGAAGQMLPGRLADIMNVRIGLVGGLLGWGGAKVYGYIGGSSDAPSTEELDTENQEMEEEERTLRQQLKQRIENRVEPDTAERPQQAPERPQVKPKPEKSLDQQLAEFIVSSFDRDGQAIWTRGFDASKCGKDSCGGGYLKGDTSGDLSCDNINSAGVSLNKSGQGFKNMQSLFSALLKAEAITMQEIQDAYYRDQGDDSQLQGVEAQDPCTALGKAIENLQKKALNDDYIQRGTSRDDAEKLYYKRQTELQEAKTKTLKYDSKTGRMVVKEEKRVAADGKFGSRTRDFLLKIRDGVVVPKTDAVPPPVRLPPPPSTDSSQTTSVSSNNKPEDWMNALMDSRRSATDLNSNRSGFMKPRIHLRFDVYSMQGSQMNPILRELTNTRMQLEERAIQLLLQTDELNVTVNKKETSADGTKTVKKVVPFNIDHAKEIGMAMLANLQVDTKNAKRLKYLQPEVLGYRAVLYQNKKDTSNRFENEIELEKLKRMDWSWLGGEATGLMDRSTNVLRGNKGGAVPSLLRNLHAPGLNVEINARNREFAPWWQSALTLGILSKDVADFSDVNQILTRLEENLKEIKLYATEVSERTGQGKGYQTTNSFRIEYLIFEPILGPELGEIEKGTMRLKDTGETRRLGRQGKANFFFDKQFMGNDNVKGGVLARGGQAPSGKVKEINKMLSLLAEKLQLPIGRDGARKIVPIYNSIDFTRTNIYVDPNSKFEGGRIGEQNAAIYQGSLSTLSKMRGIRKVDINGNDRPLHLMLEDLAKIMTKRPTASSMAYRGAEDLPGKAAAPKQ